MTMPPGFMRKPQWRALVDKVGAVFENLYPKPGASMVVMVDFGINGATEVKITKTEWTDPRGRYQLIDDRLRDARAKQLSPDPLDTLPPA